MRRCNHAAAKLLSTTALAFLCTVTLVGCGDDEPEAQTDVSECPAPHDVPLVVRAETSDEIAYVDEIDACTNAEQTETRLNNRSDLVWLPISGEHAGAGVDEMSEGADLFRRLLGFPNAVLVPGDDIVIMAPPGGVSWELDAALSLAWQAGETAREELREASLEAVLRGGRSTTSAAVTSCAVAAYRAAQTHDDAIQGGELQPTDIIVGALGTGAVTGTCTQQVRAAAVEHGYAPPGAALERRLLQLAPIDDAVSAILRAQATRVLVQLFGRG